uniref:Uncharacterized protein n=1 Tax=Tanacetum cinerariifolium TaxID=118510 RepID=A0A699GUA4_TANCI|nr:hypothetical protein [Tanacetum cinerariifolium]
MTASMVGDSNLEKTLSAKIVNKMSPSSANKKKVPSLFYSEDNSDEDVEVEVEIKDKEDNSTVKRMSRYSLGYLDFSDHLRGEVDVGELHSRMAIWIVLMEWLKPNMALKILTYLDYSAELIRVTAVSR